MPSRLFCHCLFLQLSMFLRQVQDALRLIVGIVNAAPSSALAGELRFGLPANLWSAYRKEDSGRELGRSTRRISASSSQDWAGFSKAAGGVIGQTAIRLRLPKALFEFSCFGWHGAYPSNSRSSSLWRRCTKSTSSAETDALPPFRLQRSNATLLSNTHVWNGRLIPVVRWLGGVGFDLASDRRLVISE